MLNISLIRINEKIDLYKYESFKILEKRTVSKILIQIMAVFFIIGFLAMFLQLGACREPGKSGVSLKVVLGLF